MEKGEIARYEQFLLLSQCFLKSCLLLMPQNDYLWSKGLRLQEQGLSDKKLTHSHTMTPFDASGKQAF